MVMLARAACGPDSQHNDPSVGALRLQDILSEAESIFHDLLQPDNHHHQRQPQHDMQHFQQQLGLHQAYVAQSAANSTTDAPVPSALEGANT